MAIFNSYVNVYQRVISSAYIYDLWGYDGISMNYRYN